MRVTCDWLIKVLIEHQCEVLRYRAHFYFRTSWTFWTGAGLMPGMFESGRMDGMLK